MQTFKKTIALVIHILYHEIVIKVMPAFNTIAQCPPRFGNTDAFSSTLNAVSYCRENSNTAKNPTAHKLVSFHAARYG